MHAVVNAWHVRQLVDPLRRRTHYVPTSELRITPLKKLRFSRANMGSSSEPWSLLGGISFFALSEVSKIAIH